MLEIKKYQKQVADTICTFCSFLSYILNMYVQWCTTHFNDTFFTGLLSYS